MFQPVFIMSFPASSRSRSFQRAKDVRVAAGSTPVFDIPGRNSGGLTTGPQQLASFHFVLHMMLFLCFAWSLIFMRNLRCSARCQYMGCMYVQRILFSHLYVSEVCACEQFRWTWTDLNYHDGSEGRRMQYCFWPYLYCSTYVHFFCPTIAQTAIKVDFRLGQ